MRRYTQSDNSHFDGGVYRFVGEVLKWPVSQLHMPAQAVVESGTLLDRWSSTEEYFQAFMPLVMEELRTTLHDGLQQLDHRTASTSLVTLKVTQVKTPRSSDNPYTIQCTGSHREFSPFPYDMYVIWLQGGDVLALVASDQDASQGSCRLKFIISAGSAMAAPEVGDKVHAFCIGNVVSYLRMYDACIEGSSKRSSLLLRCLIPGAGTHIAIQQLTPPVVNILRSLNPSQLRAIVKVLSMDDGSITLIQGPPRHRQNDRSCHSSSCTARVRNTYDGMRSIQPCCPDRDEAIHRGAS